MARKDLFDAMKTKLEAIDGLLVKFAPLSIDEPVKPVLAIVPATDDPTRIGKSVTQNTLNIALRLLTDTFEDAEDWAPVIRAAMKADRKWGGLANDTIPQIERWAPLDPAFPGQWFYEQPYTLTY